MKTILIFVGSLVFSLNVLAARLSDGKVHLKLQNSKIVGNVDDGFHFNKDAPAAVQVGSETVEPIKKNPKELIFDASKAKDKVFMVNFYICDDKNTVCESHEYKYKIASGKLMAADGDVEKSASTVAGKKEKPESLKKNYHGFYQDHLPEVLKLAEKSNKLVLVDFWAPWCPSCLRLETEVFGEKIFATSTKKLIKASVNIDKPENYEIGKKKYGIKTIPTLIIMNGKGEELARLTDFKPAPALAQGLLDLQAKPLISTEELQRKAEAGDATARRALAERAFGALDYESVLKWLVPLKENSLMLVSAEVSLANNKYEANPNDKAEYQKALEKAIAAHPESLEAIGWRNEVLKWTPTMKEVAAKNTEQIQKLLESDSARAEVFAKTLLGDFTGFDKSELLSQMIDTYETSGDTKKLEETQAALKKEVSSYKLSTDRSGQALLAVYYMKRANMKTEVITWYEKLILAYPKSDVYYRKLASFYKEDKQPEKALPYAMKAADLQSDSALTNMLNLAKIYRDLQKNKEALEVTTKALDLPEANLAQNKKTVGSLEELKQSIVK